MAWEPGISALEAASGLLFEHPMQRRDFLSAAGVLAARGILTSILAETLFVQSAFGQSISLESLRRILNPEEAQILVPGDQKFAAAQASFNKRTLLIPQVRVLCASPRAVSDCLSWARENRVPLALRCGGHSYEGFSQSTGLVIDTRLMKDILTSESGDRVSVGGGALLGEIYSSLSRRNLVIPAGSCPSVGVTGHATGGGYGLFARPLGLACDSLIGVEMVNAQGNLIAANDSENRDLFWACRGGGGGSFGVVTKLYFQAHRIFQTTVFGASWSLSHAKAKEMLQVWQQWAPKAPNEITTLMKVSRGQNGLFNLRCAGQSIGSEDELKQELTNSIFKVQSASRTNMKNVSLSEAVQHFSGTETAKSSVFMKGKSDYLDQVMSPEAMDVFLQNLPQNLAVIFDSYGGKVQEIQENQTAFAHRNKICSLQYYMEWSRPEQTAIKLKTLQNFYQLLRPYMTGSAYVNYCDLDLKNWPQAYWGNNLKELSEIKARHDVENLFRHAQSIPVPSRLS